MKLPTGQGTVLDYEVAHEGGSTTWEGVETMHGDFGIPRGYNHAGLVIFAVLDNGVKVKITSLYNGLCSMRIEKKVAMVAKYFRRALPPGFVLEYRVSKHTTFPRRLNAIPGELKKISYKEIKEAMRPWLAEQKGKSFN